MRTFKSQLIPIVSLLLTGITAFWAEDRLPYTHPYVVYRYSLALIIIYAFFRFIALADKRRSAQLDEVGLLRPIQEGAFLICTHTYFLELGIALGWLSTRASVEIGLFSWACLLIGRYAPQHPQGLPSRLINLIPILTSQNRRTFCKGLIISGIIGIIGTFTPTTQIVWLLVPLAITLLRVYRAQS
ncbi:MAG: hypothetical protein HOE48_02655 [Candidatus Latescibacteria bacterium]|jgi:hypothetical protein|nr:hypothetical protein [Candidatus Latescibacterota bacterium]MBT4136783.1 hypothetical protein [Candidatus Latescibacterota bacterium]MBT5830059.1 hypothetical protein [Candidatus Latescibacterota bacterium]